MKLMIAVLLSSLFVSTAFAEDTKSKCWGQHGEELYRALNEIGYALGEFHKAMSQYEVLNLRAEVYLLRNGTPKNPYHQPYLADINKASEQYHRSKNDLNQKYAAHARVQQAMDTCLQK